MSLLSTLFQNEWRQFRRQRWMPLSLLLFVIIALLAIASGRSAIQTRLIQIDSIGTQYSQDYRNVLAKFNDTSTAKAKAEAKNAGLAALINYRLPQNVIKHPNALGALSIGLMDIMSWHEQVKFVKNFGEKADRPVSNPLVLFSGNFDYAFVLVYLMPLLVIAFCFSTFDAEKAAGIIPLLAIQTGRVEKLLRLKILFRFIVLATVLIFLNLTGFVFTAAQPSGLSSYACWMLLSLCYLLFWFALSWFVVTFRKSGAVTALYLVAAWMFLLVVAPSVTNSYVQARHALPLKDEIGAYYRHQSEEIWASNARLLSDSFNRYNPQYASTAEPAKDTQRLSERSLAGYYDLLARRMVRVIQPYEAALKERNDLAQIMLCWNPASLVQSGLAGLAANDLEAYRDFVAQSDNFQIQWQRFLYPFHFAGQKLLPDDLARFPVFSYRQPPLDTASVFASVAVLILVSGLLWMAPELLKQKRNYK